MQDIDTALKRLEAFQPRAGRKVVVWLMTNTGELPHPNTLSHEFSVGLVDHLEFEEKHSAFTMYVSKMIRVLPRNRDGKPPSSIFASQRNGTRKTTDDQAPRGNLWVPEPQSMIMGRHIAFTDVTFAKGTGRPDEPLKLRTSDESIRIALSVSAGRVLEVERLLEWYP